MTGLRQSLIIVVILLAGSGLAYALYAMKPQPQRRAQDRPTPAVDTVRVARKDIVESLTGYGTAKPDRYAVLSAEVASTVIERVAELEVGSEVLAGDVLLRFDDRQYRLAFVQATALLQGDRASLDKQAADAESLKLLIETTSHELALSLSEQRRVADLYENKQAAKSEYDAANLAYQQARRTLQSYERESAAIGPNRAGLLASLANHQAGADIARLNIERCAIKAPFSGRIAAIRVEVGDRVHAGLPVVELLDPLRVEIPIQLPASAYAHMGVGSPCRLTVESMPKVRWQGFIARIAPNVDEQTRTFAAYVEVDNTTQEQPLIPGSFVRAEVRGKVWHDQLAVPRRAVRDGHVLIVEDGHARRRGILVERLVADLALVRSGLEAGDEVIVSQLHRLNDGSPVRPRLTLTGGPTAPSPIP